MNTGQTSLIFLCIIVGCFCGIAFYFSYLNWFLIPDILKNGLQVQEWRLRPAILGVCANTAGLFIFGKFSLLFALGLAWANFILW
jgi:DHA1 family multidrug resistance protein-like MFS transporter